jgi:RNA polymerase sigma factor (sigma-70 family)
MDSPLLPSVFAGYIPTVDLDAAVAALAPRLVAYATGRTGCRSTGEDVAQDALTALVVRWKRHGPPESPEAFAFAIARRRAGRAVLRRALTRPLEFVLAAQADANGIDAYEQRAELQTVMATMRRLRSADREALLLRAAGELSLNEIASVSPSTSSRISAATSPESSNPYIAPMLGWLSVANRWASR